MKTLKYRLGALFFFITSVAFSQAKTGVVTESIKVSGNCGMCRSHIEKAAKEGGATYAEWNKNTKILAVKYDASKTSGIKIQELVAKAGYDTKDVKGDDKAYSQLDQCCKYERKGSAKKQ